MNKLLSTVRTTLSQLNNLVTSLSYSFFRPALILGPVLFSFFILSSANAATLHLALIDTGFCPVKNSKFKIHPVVDLTNSVTMDCSSKASLTAPRYHGQNVLKEFLKSIETKKLQLEIHPLIIFDSKGDQKKEYWVKTIDWVKQNKIDVVLTASGLISTKDELKTMPLELPAIWFVPSGRLSPQVKESTILFPQALAPKENLFLIGDYYDGKVILYDQGLLYKDKIDFYFPSGKGLFTGTSRAVAEGAARALNFCSSQISAGKLRECLVKESKEYVDGISQKKVRTY